MSIHFEKAVIVDCPLFYKKPAGVLGTDWHVFDDHVCVDENVIERETSFFLKKTPIGQVSILRLPAIGNFRLEAQIEVNEQGRASLNSLERAR